MTPERTRHLSIIADAVANPVDLPAHLRGGLQRYIEDGIEPGGFLLACIEDRMKDAAARCSDPSLADLKSVARWLLNYVPALAWGSVEKRIAWQVRAKHSLEASP